MSTLLQECTSPHPSCFTRLVTLSKHAVFQASMCRRKKGCTHQCKLLGFFCFVLFFFDRMFIDFKVPAFQP